LSTGQSRFSSYGRVMDPLRAVLRLLCGGVEPPEYVRGYDYGNLTDDQHQALQDWVNCNLAPEIDWSTGIGVIEASEQIVAEAVANANIAPKEDQ
jgi:hypothetical protein